MLERFYNLKVCIDKALIDAGSEIKFSGDEWSIINELITKLNNQGTSLSAELAEALRNRIAERRLSEVTGTLMYLKNPKKYEKAVKKTWLFFIAKKECDAAGDKNIVKTSK
ncbi:hypothetical protein ACJJTC_006370 [Scirpophaga incertulas]